MWRAGAQPPARMHPHRGLGRGGEGYARARGLFLQPFLVARPQHLHARARTEPPDRRRAQGEASAYQRCPARIDPEGCLVMVRVRVRVMASQP